MRADVNDRRQRTEEQVGVGAFESEVTAEEVAGPQISRFDAACRLRKGPDGPKVDGWNRGIGGEAEGRTGWQENAATRSQEPWARNALHA